MPPQEPEALLEAVLTGQPLRLLEWMHLLRYKPELDERFLKRALPSAAKIWQASVEDDEVVRRMVAMVRTGTPRELAPRISISSEDADADPGLAWGALDVEFSTDGQY